MDTDGASPTGGVMVIIVDDEPEIAQEIADGLSADGIAAVVAHSAQQAITLLETLEDRVGVVVTDLRMPGIDGLTLIRRLRSGGPGTAMPEVVLMSGHASPEELLAARNAGARAVLRKPFAWDDLANAVDSALATVRHRKGQADTASDGS
jgi:CheY-like chemotaxis protein